MAQWNQNLGPIEQDVYPRDFTVIGRRVKSDSRTLETTCAEGEISPAGSFLGFHLPVTSVVMELSVFSLLRDVASTEDGRLRHDKQIATP